MGSDSKRSEKDRQPGAQTPPLPFRGFFETLQKLGITLPHSYRSPFLLLLSLVMVIAVAESLAMIALQLLPPLPVYVEALIDSTLLLLVISPALFIIFFRPLVRQIFIREEAERALNQLNLGLEHQVKQRTAQLQDELSRRERVEKRLIEYQKQLRILSSELSLVEERERHRMATELHDNIGHALAMINNQLGLLEGSLTSSREMDLLQSIERQVKESIRYTRTLTAEFSPPWFHASSIVSALKGLAEDTLKRQGIDVELQTDSEPSRLGEGERVFLLKAIQEIFVNIVKHAKAHRVSISLNCDDGNVIVSIADDGIGFDVDALPLISSTHRKGLGIFTIRERLAHLNGSFSIDSRPGHGTVASLTVPTMQLNGEENVCI